MAFASSCCYSWCRYASSSVRCVSMLLVKLSVVIVVDIVAIACSLPSFFGFYEYMSSVGKMFKVTTKPNRGEKIFCLSRKETFSLWIQLQYQHFVKIRLESNDSNVMADRLHKKPKRLELEQREPTIENPDIEYC